MSTKLPTKRLTINMPNVKRAASLFTRQFQLAETFVKASVVFSALQSLRCTLCGPYIYIVYGYINNIR